MAVNKYYVWTGGDNSDGRTWETAFTSIFNALSSTSTGNYDELYLHPGENHLIGSSLTINKFQRIEGANAMQDYIDLWSIDYDNLTIFMTNNTDFGGNSIFILNNQMCVYKSLAFFIMNPVSANWGVEIRVKSYFEHGGIGIACPFDGTHSINGGILLASSLGIMNPLPHVIFNYCKLFAGSEYVAGLPPGNNPPSPVPFIKSYGNLVIDHSLIGITKNWQIQSAALPGANNISIIKNSVIAIIYNSQQNESPYDWKWINEDPSMPITFFNNTYIAFDGGTGNVTVLSGALPYGALKPDKHVRDTITLPFLDALPQGFTSGRKLKFIK
jgi:hypothetical protein